MRPSLGDVLADDDLLDRLARRRSTTQDVAEPIVGLLAALTDDVDAGLPSDAGTVAGAPVRQRRRRGRALGVGGVVGVALLFMGGSAGVAAAVSGDPAGAFGVRAVRAVISGRQPMASPDQLRRLTSRIDAAARRQAGPDREEVERLRAAADRLPDDGGPLVRRRLDALVAGLDIAGPSPAATDRRQGGPAARQRSGADAAASDRSVTGRAHDNGAPKSVVENRASQSRTSKGRAASSKTVKSKTVKSKTVKRRAGGRYAAAAARP